MEVFVTEDTEETQRSRSKAPSKVQTSEFCRGFLLCVLCVPSGLFSVSQTQVCLASDRLFPEVAVFGGEQFAIRAVHFEPPGDRIDFQIRPVSAGETEV